MHGIVSLSHLLEAQESDLLKVMPAEKSKRDYGRLLNRIADLQTLSPDLEPQETKQWLRIRRGLVLSGDEGPGTWGGLCLEIFSEFSKCYKQTMYALQISLRWNVTLLVFLKSGRI